MEPPETLTLIEPILPKRNMFDAITGLVPKPICNRVCGWFGGERNLGLFVAATAATVGVVKIIVYIKKQNRRKKWNAVGKDVVVLHTFQRGKFVPNISPFALKLETYLKLADIKYEVDFSEPTGPKGKVPWITLNGESIPDSQFIIETLGQQFGKDLSSHLTQEQRGVARAMRIMMEDHFFWCFEVCIFFLMDSQSVLDTMNFSTGTRFLFFVMLPLIRKKMKKLTYMVGIGRHTNKEVIELGEQDLAALSNWLGNKKFLMGDKPTEVDCAIFGLLAQFVWNFPTSPFGTILKSDYANLTEYCHRMKETIWPDWNTLLDPPQP